MRLVRLVVLLLLACCHHRASKWADAPEQQGDEGEDAPRREPAKIKEDYRLFTAEQPAPTARLARQFYRGDVAKLDAVGARLIGTYRVQGSDGATPALLDAFAAEHGAAHGGTHFVLVDEGDVERVEHRTVEGSTGQKIGLALMAAGYGAANTNGCAKIYTAGCDRRGERTNEQIAERAAAIKAHDEARVVTDKVRVYLIVYVPPDRWGELPRVFWPRPRPTAP